MNAFDPAAPQEGTTPPAGAHQGDPCVACETVCADCPMVPALTSSQTDSSLRAAEPTTLTVELCPHCGGSTLAETGEVTTGGYDVTVQCACGDGTLGGYARYLEGQLSELRAASSPTVTPPNVDERAAAVIRAQTRFVNDIRRAHNKATTLEDYRERVQSAIDALNAAHLALPPLDEPKLIRSSPPVTEEAPNERSSVEQIGADRLAGAVCRLVDRHVIDARSEAGDALLDYASTRHGDHRPIQDVRETYAAIVERFQGLRAARSTPTEASNAE